MPWQLFERAGFLPIPLHYYQPYPTQAELTRSGFWSHASELPGVSVDLHKCLALLDELGVSFGDECAWPEVANAPHVYHTGNDQFGFASAAVAHALVRRLKPRLIIEVGSGYSTHILAGALDRNRGDGRPGVLHCIDPARPAILDTSIPAIAQRIHQPVETIPTDFFSSLGESDLLFIDSSHIIRYGGDVLFLYLEILPRLRPGVWVHIHDIHLPGPYPEAYYALERRVWNEQYLLQALLMHSRAFEVVLPCWWIHLRHDDRFAAAFRRYHPSRHRPGSSLWMRRTA